jgi:WD40 repeat protein
MTPTDSLSAGSKAIPRFRVFVSSPGDVAPEREAFEAVVRRVAATYSSHVDVTFARWEAQFYQATHSFQEQIEATAEFDLVVGIVWKRIGTELDPDLYQRPNSTAFESGTVFEIESALQASALDRGRPAVFMFRKTAEILFSKTDVETEKRQSDLLDAWWNRTFCDEVGHFRLGFQSFATTEQFEDQFENLLIDRLRVGSLIPTGPVWDIAGRGSPYPGLEPYDRDRRAVFFGRELAIRDACDELVAKAAVALGLPTLFVIGPSGSGKSSLVRAGIVPKLTDPGTVRNVDCWRSVTVETGLGLLTTLAARLYAETGLPELADGPQKDAGAWATLAAASPPGAAEAIVWALRRVAAAEKRRIGANRMQQARLLLVIDQLERLFGTDDARNVPGVLRALVETGQVWLIATLRSDRYAALQGEPDLLELKRRGVLYDLPAPGRAEIADIVKGPARAAGLIFEPIEHDGRTLAGTLIANAPNADALPLLQMTLRRLFDTREGISLTWNAYNAMGGVAGAITTQADTMLRAASTLARAALPSLISEVTRDVGRDASGRVRFTVKAAESAWSKTTARRELLDRMVAARLLVSDEPESGRTVFRVAHEALLRQWNPARIALQRIADRALRRARLRQLAALTVSMVLFAALLMAFYQWTESQKRAIFALSQSSDAHFAAGEDWEALVTGLQAAQIFQAIPFRIIRTIPFIKRFAPNSASDISQDLQQAVYRIREYKRVKFEQESDISRQSAMGQLAWNPSGDRLAFVSGHDSVTVWTLDGNSPSSIIKLVKDNNQDDDAIESVSWKPPDTDVLVISSGKGKVQFFGPPKTEPLQNERTYRDYGISWRPDGQELASASFSDGFRLLRPDMTELPNPFPDLAQPWSIAWSPGPDSALAAGGLTRNIEWTNQDSTSQPCKKSLGSWIRDMSWSPDGKFLAVGLEDNTVRLIPRGDCESKFAATPLKGGHIGPVTAVSWGQDGRLATASKQDRTVRLWDEAGTALDTINSPTVEGGVRWRPDGQVLATLDQYGLVKLWKDNPLIKTFVVPANVAVTDAALSPDGQVIASASKNGISLWRQGQDGKWPSAPQFLPGFATNVTWSPDGKLLASTNYDQSQGYIVKVWNTDNASTRKPLTNGAFANGIFSIGWSDDGKVIAIGVASSQVVLFDVDSGFTIGSAAICGDWVQALAWNPKIGDSLAAGCHNLGGGYRLKWEPDSKVLFPEKLPAFSSEVSGISWSPDGKLLATSGKDGLRVWSLDRDALTRISTGEEMGKVAWSPDGQILAVAKGNVVDLRKQDGSLVMVLKGHTRPVTSVTWNEPKPGSGSGGTLVSASEEGTVKLWRMDAGLADNVFDIFLAHSCERLTDYLSDDRHIGNDDVSLQHFCSRISRNP